MYRKTRKFDSVMGDYTTRQSVDQRLVLTPNAHYPYCESVITVLRAHYNVMAAEIDHCLILHSFVKHEKQVWPYEEIKDLGVRLKYERFSETSMRFTLSHNKPLPVFKVFTLSFFGQAPTLYFDHCDNLAVLEIGDSFPNVWKSRHGGVVSDIQLQLVTNKKIQEHMIAITTAMNCVKNVSINVVYNNPKYCDVTLISEEDDSFIASSDVLSAHSHVFEAMFSNSYLEGQTRQAKIHGVSTILLDAIVRFCHTGECDVQERFHAFDLLTVADMYGISRLVGAIEHNLVQSICLDEVATFLTLADKYQMSDLKEKCFSILKSHFKFGMLSNFKTLSQLTSVQLLRQCLSVWNSVDLAKPLWYAAK